MLPGLPGGGLSPKKMQAMMKQMGIDQKEVPAKRVIIEKSDGNIIISNPNVQKITMQGQESYQITGDESEESQAVSFSEEDILLVSQKTGKSKEEARNALEETKDIVEAIEKLTI